MSQTLDLHRMPLSGRRLVEASAGTGKTFSLSALYLRALVEPWGTRGKPLTVEEIAVVTFTINATDELKGRIALRLKAALDWIDKKPVEATQRDAFVEGYLPEHAISSESKTALKVRLLAAYRSIDAAPIDTIHGFCLRALSERSAEAGLLAEHDALGDDRHLILQAATDFWTRKMASMPAMDTAIVAELVDSPKAILDFLYDAWNKPNLELRTGGNNALQPAREKLSIALSNFAQHWQGNRHLVETFFAAKKHYGVSENKKTGLSQERVNAAVDRIDQWNLNDSPPLPEIELFSYQTLLREQLPAAAKKGELVPGNVITEAADQVVDAARDVRAGIVLEFYGDAVNDIANAAQRDKRDLRFLGFDDLVRGLHEGLKAPTGGALARRLAQQWPLLMVDEFQDTDPLQYAIFSAINKASDEGGLLMIGDPKQAIYAFRGGDVFGYLDAARQVEADAAADGEAGSYSLDTNWRSAPRLVGAVNALFSRPNTFLLDEVISFKPVNAHRKRSELQIDGYDGSGLVAWVPELESRVVKRDAERQCARWVANEVTRLLSPGCCQLSRKSLRGGDIAVLVRTNEQVDFVVDALAELGISAAARSDLPVVTRAEANDLRLLVEAVSDPTRVDRVRAAFASRLLGRGPAELVDCEVQQERWIEQCRAWADYWRLHGVHRWFYRLLTYRAADIMRFPGGARRMTNYLHLLDLIAAELGDCGPRALLNWLHEKSSGEHRAVENELRLESDQHVVQVMTTHRSKGLEFPVVFLPFAWTMGTGTRASAPSLYHDRSQGFRPCLALDAASVDVAQADIAMERQGEAIRMLYVALTRARERCYVVASEAFNLAWGTARALDWLLDPSREEPLQAKALEVEPAVRQMVDDLGDGSMHLARPPARPTTGIDVGPEMASLLMGRSLKPTPVAYSIHSYSSLAHGGSNRVTTAAMVDIADLIEETVIDRRIPARGAAFGIFVHRLLERWAQGHSVAEEELKRQRDLAGYTEKQVPIAALCSLVEATLKASLPPGGHSLQALTDSERAAELEFDLAVPAQPTDALSQAWQQLRGGDIRLNKQRVGGLLRGFIDLVVRIDGRYYVVDYKTNDLPEYSAKGLELAMLEHDYDLQYLLYLLALHRHLGARLHDYDPRHHLGGALYLFVRGMAADSESGVFYRQAPVALIEQLDLQWR